VVLTVSVVATAVVDRPAMTSARGADGAQSPAPAASPGVVSLRTEYKEHPLGIDTAKPRLSWKITSGRRGTMQGGYQIRVARTERDLRAGARLVWDSARVASDQSVNHAYAGPPLVARQRYYWQVRAWDDAGVASSWSEPAWWEMGLLQPSDWQARWVEPDVPDNDPKPAPAPMLRREFALEGKVAQARLYVTSHGLYELHLNGQRVGDQVFTPGWTSYNKRLQYQTYDVTSLVKSGENALGALLGSGWYRGELAWESHRNLYGKHVGLLLQLEVTYANGKKDVVTTDDRWKAATGPILASEIYFGEIYDARLEQPGWDTAAYDDAQWKGVRSAEYPLDILVASEGPPVRRVEEITPVKILKTPAGDTVVDMGQNMVGWVRLKVQGAAGKTVTLRHAEVLDKAGNFYTENLRHAKATVQYTLKGGGVETFEPHFTFQGFRYVAVDGYPGELALDDLEGIVIHSDMRPSSSFETSKPLVNQLQHNILWGQKGNFLDVPTDCPQRDERLGWTGDAQVFSRTAAFNMDVAAFFTKWMKDLAADQYPSGSVPHVIPDVLKTFDGKEAGGSAAWADAAVIIPWTMYLSYGDTRILEQQYPSMKRWVEFERTRSGPDYIWDGDFHFGDWLAFATTRSDYPGATTGKDLIATAMFAHSSDLLHRAARVLGKEDEAAHYADLSGKVRDAFVKEFVTSTGRVGENTQTAYVLALEFDLLPEDLRSKAARKLADDVRERKHLTTGFVGTPYLCHVLTRYGYLDEAYMLLNREEYPSWLYPVKQGATTIWERWDGRKPDGSFQDKGMNSFNHYAYGAIGAWMYSTMAGIDIDEAAPGYKHSLFQPRPGGGFTSVSANHESMYGKVGSAWTLEGGRFDLSVQVAPNTRGTVRLPNARLGEVTMDGKPLVIGEGVTATRQDGEAVVVDVGSGSYRFSYPMSAPAQTARR
jgi:alpha-L-rhamnosidase